jgi:hypothetical protein
MSFVVRTVDKFEKESRRLLKKFPSLKSELNYLINRLEREPTTGVSIGHGFYKIRLAIRSKGKGKRGGARVITFVKVVDETVYLVTIYDKSDQSDIALTELIGLL